MSHWKLATVHLSPQTWYQHNYQARLVMMPLEFQKNDNSTMFCPEQGLEMATIIRFYAEILGATRKPRYESVLRTNSWADDHNGRPE